MIETQFSIFDAVVIAVMATSCLFAFFRGFVREILSLGAWIGAGIVTIYYFPDAAEWLKPHFKTPVVAAGFATLGLYITALIGFSILNRFILKFIKSGDEVGPTDNILGLVFGALRGAFIVSLGFFMLLIALPENDYPDWLKQSVTLPYAEKGAMLLISVAPDYLKDMADLQKKMQAEAQAAERKGIWNREPDIEREEQDIGYSRGASRQFDRLLDSVQDDGPEDADE